MTPDAGIVAALIEELDDRAASGDVARTETGDGVEYRANGELVAAVEGSALSFRLGRLVARAAAGTPDAMASPRGPDWVRLAPMELDRFTLDRATSWFDLAVRLVTAEKPSRPDA